MLLFQASIDLEPLLFDNLNHGFVVIQEFTLIPQAVHIPRRIIP